MVTQEEWMSAAATESLDMATMDALVARSVEAWKAYDAVAEEAKKLREKAEEVDNLILSSLKAAGKSKYFVDGIGTMRIRQQAMVRVPSSIEKKRAFRDYIRSIDPSLELSMFSVPSQTLNAWYREKLEEASSKGILGFKVPGIDDPTMRETLAFTKDKKGTHGKS